MSEDVKKKSGGFHYAFLIVAAGIAITCVPCALVLSCAGIYFTPVSSYFGVPRAQFTVYFSILNLAMMIMLPIAGKLMSKMDLRIILSAAVIIDGVTYLIMSNFTAIWQFYVAGVFLGIGTAPLIYLAVPTLINAWCKKRVGFFIGLCMAFTGIGGVIFNPVGTALINASADGWRTGYMVFGILMLVLTLPFTIFVVRSKPADKGLAPYGAEEVTEDGKPAAPEVGVSANKAMKTGAFVAIALFSFLITVNQTVYQFMPSYCTSFADTLPDIAALSGVVASACMAGQAIGKVILGAINDKSTKGGLAFGIGSGLIGVALMAFLPFQAVLLMIGAFLFGFVYACTTVQTPLLTRAVFGNRDYTNIYSRISMAGTLGGVIASTFWAVIVDMNNGFMLMFLLSAVCMVLCFLLGIYALKSGEKLEKTTE
jgi:MFS family permease